MSPDVLAPNPSRSASRPDVAYHGDGAFFRQQSCQIGTLMRPGSHTATPLRSSGLSPGSGCCFPAVSVVDAADTLQPGQLGSRRPRLDLPTARSVFADSGVGAVLVVVGHVLAAMRWTCPFVNRNHMVEALAARAADPAFRRAILPGTRTLARTARIPEDSRSSITSGLNLESRSRITKP